MTALCPTWCTAEGEHTLHHRLVGRQGDITVTLRQSGDSLPEVATPDGTLTLAAARVLGQALIAGGQDGELGELLIAAADLAESGGAR